MFRKKKQGPREIAARVVKFEAERDKQTAVAEESAAVERRLRVERVSGGEVKAHDIERAGAKAAEARAEVDALNEAIETARAELIEACAAERSADLRKIEAESNAAAAEDRALVDAVIEQIGELCLRLARCGSTLAPPYSPMAREHFFIHLGGALGEVVSGRIADVEAALRETVGATAGDIAALDSRNTEAARALGKRLALVTASTAEDLAEVALQDARAAA